MTTFRRSRRLTRLLASCVAVASLLSGSVSYASSQTPPAAPVLGPSLAEASMGPSPTPGPLGIPQTTPLQSFDERAKAGQSRCLGLPCTRPGMARLLAGVSGLLAMAGGTAMLMWIPRWSEPGGHIAGAGPVAVSGAIIGAVIGILSSERRAVDDRVQTATLGASYQRPAQAPLGEFHPGSLNVQASPVLRFSGQSSYLRPILILGSQLGRRTMLDPRPQAEHEIIGRLQTWQLAAGIEYGMWLPYPSRRKRHGYLGPVELLFRSFLETRRENCCR